MKIINNAIVVTAAAATMCIPCAADISSRHDNQSYNSEYSSFCAVPLDSEYDNSRVYYEKIQMEKAWDVEQGGDWVKVGVIDSGINYRHEDLGGRVDYELSKDFTGGNSPCTDNYGNYGHGTQVAGVIGAIGNNNSGTSGVCWSGVTLISYKVSLVGTASQVTQAINEAKASGVKLLNISMDVTVTDELKNAVKSYPGLIVCAAGNDSRNIDSSNLLSSLNYSNILVVGATESVNDNIASFSNYGATSVDLFAPGVEIYTTYSTGGYGANSGTSFSAPLVTGTVELLMSRYSYKSIAQLKATIMDNVDKVSGLSGKCVSGGRLNAYSAIMNLAHVHTMSYVKRDAIMHDYKCSDCGYVASSGMHVLLDDRGGYKICKFCKYMTQIGFKPGGDFSRIGGGMQSVDEEELCEHCEEQNIVPDTAFLDGLKDSLVA